MNMALVPHRAEKVISIQARPQSVRMDLVSGFATGSVTINSR